MEDTRFGVFPVGSTYFGKGTMTLEQAEEQAAAWSSANAVRYISYAVVEHGQDAGEGTVVSLWVRGTKTAPDALPRAEVRELFVGSGDKRVVAKIPVVDGDDTWSLNAGGVIGLHMAESRVVLVGADGRDVKNG